MSHQAKVPVPTPESYQGPCQQWWEPIPLPPAATAADARRLLTPEQVQSFISDGFIAVNDLYPERLVAQAAREAAQYFPTALREESIEGPLDMVDARGEPWGSRLHRSVSKQPPRPLRHVAPTAPGC
eukprot:SAG11_NODE_12129_length_720_cov_1.405797_1_plen_127_part_00